MPIDPIQIVPIYAALHCLVFLLLSIRVISYRRRHRIGFGSGGDSELERRIRVHGNFTEYVPFVLLLLALAELRGANQVGLHVAGLSLLFGRLAHAIGVSQASSDDLGRILGMTGSQSAAILSAILIGTTYLR